jgi:hypothetical protein
MQTIWLKIKSFLDWLTEPVDDGGYFGGDI